MIEFVNSDAGMCGQIRMLWPSQILGANEFPVCTSRCLLVADNIEGYYVQRAAQKGIFDVLRSIKARKILDFDDMFFKLYGEEFPVYNHCRYEIDLEESTKAFREGLNAIDKLTVSTDFLKNAIMDNYSFNRIEVVPNFLPRFIFKFDRREHIDTDIKKPTILYAGSRTHYSCSDIGDWNKELASFLIKNIDNINLVILGQLPWFLNLIMKKVKVIPFVNVLDYPMTLNSIKPDFIIAPLRENVFNKCKSNLKYLESASVGALCIGSTFPDSPYNCIDERCRMKQGMTVTELEKMFKELCHRDTFNEILDNQYKYLNNMWLEENIDLYARLFGQRRRKI